MSKVTLIKIAKAAPYCEVTDLFVHPVTMALYGQNHFHGNLFKFDRLPTINWNQYRIIREDICTDFFGYEAK